MASARWKPGYNDRAGARAAWSWYRADFLLFWNFISRTTELFWKMFEFSYAVLDPKNGLAIMDVHLRLKGQSGQDGCVNVYETLAGMLRHHVTPALPTVLPMASFSFLVDCEQLFAQLYLHGFELPKGEAIYGRGSPGTAIIAMTISHSKRLTSSLNFDCSAEAAAVVSRLVRVMHFRSPP
jgi:hypothetical protein